MGPEALLALALLSPLAHAWSLPSLSQSSHKLFARQSLDSYPKAISIGPSQYWDGNDGNWSSFQAQIGQNAQQQSVRLFISTAFNDVLTIGATGCMAGSPPNCPALRGQFYLNNESSTALTNSVFNLGFEDNFDGADFTANSYFDWVNIGYQGSPQPQVEHQAVFSTGDPSYYWLGLFGLLPYPTNFTTLNDPQPSFMSQLANRYKNISSLSYGYSAGARYQGTGTFGTLTLGGYDANRFDNTKAISLPMATDINRDLVVWLQGITTSSGSPSNLLPGGAIDIFIDSTFAQIWLPQSACDAFATAFGLTYNSESNFYFVNSSSLQQLQSTNPNVTFTIATAQTGGQSVEIVFPYSAFDTYLGFPYINTSTPTTAYFPIRQAANSTQYTLGRAFLQQAYIIADYDRLNFTVAEATFDNTQSTNIKTIYRSNDTTSSSSGQNSSASSGGGGSSAGAIAGGVVGGVAGAAALAGALLWFLRRRKTGEKKRLAELEASEKAAGKDSHDSAGEGKPFISGNEIGGGEIHELNSQHKPLAQEMESPFKMDPNKHGYSEMSGGEFFAPQNKGVPAEMHGDTPVFEMAGSDVHELPTPQPESDPKPAVAEPETTTEATRQS